MATWVPLLWISLFSFLVITDFKYRLLMAWVWISCHAFVFLLLIFKLFGLGHNVFMFHF